MTSFRKVEQCTMGNDHLTVCVDELVSFFDEPSNESRGHTSAILGIIGEELGSSLICHYLKQSDRRSVMVLSHKGVVIKPKTRGRKGPSLDRWILTEDHLGKSMLHQVEIKNWNAHSVMVPGAGVPLKLEASAEEVQAYRTNAWKEIFNPQSREFRCKNGKSDARINKVLIRMERPSEVDDSSKLRAVPENGVHPLICFWFAIHPQGRDEPLFFTEFSAASAYGFNGVWVFSMSNYLRKIRSSGVRTIALPMPLAKRRLDHLTRLAGLTASWNLTESVPELEH